MKTMVMAAAFAALIGTPAFAQAPAPGTGEILQHRTGNPPVRHGARSRHRAAPTSAYAAVTPFGSPTAAPPRSGREAAIHDCNGEAAKTYPTRDSNWSISMYRGCMAQRGQME